MTSSDQNRESRLAFSSNDETAVFEYWSREKSAKAALTMLMATAFADFLPYKP